MKNQTSAGVPSAWLWDFPWSWLDLLLLHLNKYENLGGNTLRTRPTRCNTLCFDTPQQHANKTTGSLYIFVRGSLGTKLKLALCYIGIVFLTVNCYEREMRRVHFKRKRKVEGRRKGIGRGRGRRKGNWKWSFGRNGKNRKRPSRELNPGPQETNGADALPLSHRDKRHHQLVANCYDLYTLDWCTVPLQALALVIFISALVLATISLGLQSWAVQETDRYESRIGLIHRCHKLKIPALDEECHSALSLDCDDPDYLSQAGRDKQSDCHDG